jgi:DNA-binding NtrC family response regulator
VTAYQGGAFEYLPKPFDVDELAALVQRALQTQPNAQPSAAAVDEDMLVGEAPAMQQVFRAIGRLTRSHMTALVTGESGTGKELVARALHRHSPRARQPFIALNTAAIPAELLESELFGHERGSFTGAERRKKGRFEVADGGTLFLDEVGDVSPAMQAKLLRVLQSGSFERVGGTETLHVDVRIVAATNKRLEGEVQAGRFRADLYYRLNVVRIELPPLRERPEDIPLLATYFLEKMSTMSNPPVTRIDSEAMQALLGHSWPGHVRELENAIKAAVALAEGSAIHRELLPETVAPRALRPAGANPLIDIERPLPDLTNDLIGQVERDYFSRLLTRYKGNVARCAKHSGLSRRSVTQKLQKYSLDRARFKDVTSIEPIE